ncbi:MAG: Fe-S cluster assembly protein SufD [Gammaproteobacteria bacterium]|nr:Fe-S cluster assembly protein SufD [Gammaproteobacteria bacterium]
MTGNTAIDFLDAAPAPRDEPRWRSQLRDRAWEHFSRHGLPTRRDENWKYTNLRAIDKGQFTTGSLPPGETSVAPIGADKLAVVSFVDGQVTQRQDAPGLSLRLSAELGDEDFGLGELVDFDTHPLAALNSAYFDDAVVIDVAAGQVFDQPLLLEYVSTARPAPVLTCPRVFIRMGANTQLTVVERFVGVDGAANLTNAVTEVELGTGARLDHYRLQELSDSDKGISLLRARQHADSRLVARSIDIGGRLVRNDVHATLSEPGASCRLSGFYLCLGRQHTDNHTRIDHDAADTNSDEVYHGVLGGRARGVFNGKVIVRQDSQRVNANQSNRNLLLSGTAEIDTKPELEIYADDVRCSHGATVGQLDDEALFYLRSRGIGERTARALLTFAFAEEVVRDIEVDAVRDYLEHQVALRLPDHERLEKLV